MLYRRTPCWISSNPCGKSVDGPCRRSLMEPGSLHTVRAILIFLNDGVEQAQPFFVCPELKDDALQQLESAGAKTAIAKLLEQRETDSWSGEDLDRAKNPARRRCEGSRRQKRSCDEIPSSRSSRTVAGARSDHHLVPTGSNRSGRRQAPTLHRLIALLRFPALPPGSGSEPVAGLLSPAGRPSTGW